MVIIMQAGASTQDVDYIARRAASLGLKAHVSQQDDRTVVGLLGDFRGFDISALQGLRGVDRVLPLAQSYRLASREFKKEPTVVHVGDCEIGGDRIVAMAGPCSVESSQQVMETALSVVHAGARLLRGGAFKPRTSPYSFDGLAEEGLKILAEARAKTGLWIVTEVMSPEQVPLVAEYADLLQIGTRNMQNYPLLHAVGDAKKPVLLKRGMMATIEEFLMSAEYILSHGNSNVVLCERGIRTFETSTRNSLDINAIPVLKELTHLPIVVDPSHATGRASLVGAASKAAIAAGADGLLIEVHPDPENAWSDGFQSLTFDQFRKLMNELLPLAAAVGRRF